MSVIGRLDQQVEAVLITPLKKRGQHKEDEARQDTERSAERTRSSSETNRQSAGGDKQSEQETPPLRDELPVWLL